MLSRHSAATEIVPVADWLSQLSREEGQIHSYRREEDKAVESAIESARWILELNDNFDGEQSQGYSAATWNRATDFLRRHAVHANRAYGDHIRVPAINPADSGSIDLFWESPEFQLLVNFPSDEGSLASFFGSDQEGETIGGTFRPDKIYPELISWLLRHRR